jgi:CRP-like cAMP-binding protein
VDLRRAETAGVLTSVDIALKAAHLKRQLMARREATSLGERRRRAALLDALKSLRKESRGAGATASSQLRVARAYRALGKSAPATEYFRAALARLRTSGDAVRALAVAKELSDLSGDSQMFKDLADHLTRARPFSKKGQPPTSSRIAVPLPSRVTRPVNLLVREGPPVVDADAMLKVHDASDIAESDEITAPPDSLVPDDVLDELAEAGEIVVVPANPLVPADVLAELQRRGEIEIREVEPRDASEEPPQEVGEADLLSEDAAERAASINEALSDVATPMVAPGDRVDTGELEGDASPATARPEEPGAQRSRESGGRIDTEEVIDNLARVPLFSDLPRPAFVELARKVTVVPYEPGQSVFQEGEPARSFFLVADGTFEAVRELRGIPTVLKQVGVGEVLGLFGVVAEQKRAATVRAVTEALAIEIPSKALDGVLERHPIARLALNRFYRERLLHNFLASSPLFADLNSAARDDLSRRFEEKRLAPKDVLVSPGEVFNGLFLVMSGCLRIHRRLGTDEEVAQIRRGHFFGVVSALSGIPVRVQVTATEGVTLVYLPQKSFNEFVREHPTLRALPARLAEEGLLVEKDVFVGKTGIPGLS